MPADLPRIDATATPKIRRPVSVCVVRSAKERAPAAALALIERLAS